MSDFMLADEACMRLRNNSAFTVKQIAELQAQTITEHGYFPERLLKVMRSNVCELFQFFIRFVQLPDM
jgi:hypothetical protein